MHDADPDLPASIEAAWGRRGRSAKGPRPGLTLERITGAAIRVAGAEGFSAVSMARVAAELSSSAMSLYRYVASKDELLALMVDAALGTPPPARTREGWRAGLSRWAWAHHEGLRAHPWVLRVPIAGPPVTPNQTAWLEAGLRALGGTPLSEADKLSVLLLLSGFVRNEATLTADIGAGDPGREIMPAWGRMLGRLTDVESHPALHAALASEAFAQDDDPDDEFTFGLERILDGVAALVRRTAR